MENTNKCDKENKRQKKHQIISLSRHFEFHFLLHLVWYFPSSFFFGELNVCAYFPLYHTVYFHLSFARSHNDHHLNCKRNRRFALRSLNVRLHFTWNYRRHHHKYAMYVTSHGNDDRKDADDHKYVMWVCICIHTAIAPLSGMGHLTLARLGSARLHYIDRLLRSKCELVHFIIGDKQRRNQFMSVYVGFRSVKIDFGQIVNVVSFRSQQSIHD